MKGEIKTLILRGKPKEAIDKLLIATENNYGLHKEVVLLSASYQKILSDRRAGISKPEDQDRGFQKINSSLLEILDLLERDSMPKEVSSYFNFFQLLAFLGFLLFISIIYFSYSNSSSKEDKLVNKLSIEFKDNSSKKMKNTTQLSLADSLDFFPQIKINDLDTGIHILVDHVVCKLDSNYNRVYFKKPIVRSEVFNTSILTSRFNLFESLLLQKYQWIEILQNSELSGLKLNEKVAHIQIEVNDYDKNGTSTRISILLKVFDNEKKLLNFGSGKILVINNTRSFVKKNTLDINFKEPY